MGIAIIGGLISSTLLTLVVVPAIYSYVERFRVWSLGLVRGFFGNHSEEVEAQVAKADKKVHELNA
jgi:HAE1 family hydrophobic/amphiphilic exporter-1